ncbi:MAG: phosphotransferase family protein [Pararhizobium sp.]
MTDHGLDHAALAAFLADRFGRADDLTIERVSGGQSNPTFFVTHGGQRMVLRKKPSGPILKGAHAIDREFRLLTALQATDVPVPRPLLYYGEADVLDTAFYLMQRLEGRVFHDAALREVPAEDRAALYLAMAEALARLHAVDPGTVGLGDFGRSGNYFERQIRRWSTQWKAAAIGPIPELDALARWLPANLPQDDGRIAIAHGDFRIGNMLFHPREPRVIGILDWELATLGHPLADLAFAIMPWRTSPDEYGGIRGLDHAALGLPGETEFVAHYEACAKPAGRLAPFHVAFALFRFAVIFVGIAERARAGTAAGANAADLAPLARRFAIRATEAAGL